MDSRNWRKQEVYASSDFEEAKQMYAIYRYQSTYPDFIRNVRLKEVRISDLDVPVERL